MGVSKTTTVYLVASLMPPTPRKIDMFSNRILAKVGGNAVGFIFPKFGVILMVEMHFRRM